MTLRRTLPVRGLSRTMLFRLMLALIMLQLTAAAAGAQGEGLSRTPELPSDSLRAAEEGESAWETVWTRLRRMLLPEPVGIMLELREHITKLEPQLHRSRESDLKRLDEIFERAVYLAEGDAMQALLILTWATLPYHRFPAVLPLLNWTITVPVSTETRAAFDRRLANLPGVLLKDSPPSLDRDKLPHFFGSAWLQCAVNSPEIADAGGSLLEWMEEIFKLEGFRDERDIVVNRLGIIFGMQLQRQRAVRPSDIFMLDLDYHESTKNSRR